jgi:ribosomal protein S18 acetylase RimI-like enzyme
MSKSTFKIRLMQSTDYAAVVRIDEKVLKVARPEYYKLKFEELVQSTDRLPTSFVAEQEDGTVVGFVIGELFIGEYGISQEATLVTIGVDPDYQNKGIGKKLIDEFVGHLRSLGARKISTLVDSTNSTMMHFFTTNLFTSSKTVNLERVRRD